MFTKPTNATKCVLWIRHSESVQEGDNRTRTLTPEGVRLCALVAAYYKIFVRNLAEVFGPPEYAVSEMARAFATCWELFHPSHIKVDPRLNLIVSLKKINGGAWIKERTAQGKADAEIIREAAENLEGLFADQLLDVALSNAAAVATGKLTTDKFTVAVGHEPCISFFAGSARLPTDQLGLDECQAIVFFTDDEDNIVGMEKIVPTIEPEDSQPRPVKAATPTGADELCKHM